MYPTREFVFDKLSPALSYLLGVYLGDGHIALDDKGEPQKFVLDTIDYEFANFTKQCAELKFGPLPDIKDYDKYFRFSFGSKPFCKWLVEVTFDKKKIPQYVTRTKPVLKRFLEGFLDSEGWVSQSKNVNSLGHHNYQVGFVNMALWVDEIAKLVQQFHVKLHSRRLCYTKDNKPFVMYTCNIKSFIRSGLQFHINRKQQRLEQYRKEYMTPSETIRLP